ncbi:hypothetical protein FACS189485_04270 [Spirochaetia bacterium]|nr:hypothetical protein FACS189485_04270 [Spirochaetia bacterium]
MNTHPQGGIRLAVLIPHRDSRNLLRAWSARLFAAGLCGAWSFPWAAPLGIISRFLTQDELNDLAHALRDEGLADGGDGKMRTGAAAVLPFPADGISAAGADIAGQSEGAHAAFFGPTLDLRLPEPLFAGSAAGALIRGFSRPVLASALVCRIPPDLPPPPAISFRAAAAANMIYRALPVGSGAYSFEWQIGELHWLPSVKVKKRGG